MNSEVETLTIFNYIGNTFYFIFGLICMSSSLLVLYICLTKCDRKATEIRLIFIFCFIEIVSSTEFIFFSLFKLIYGYIISERGTIACNFSAFTLFSFPRISLINICILATLRYLLVCHSKELKLSTWLVILLVPIIGLLTLFSFGFYTNDAAPSASYLYCTAFTNKNALSTGIAYFILFILVIPCWITTYCYFMVGWTANKRLNTMRQEAINSSDEVLVNNIKKQRIKLWIQLLFVFIIYNVNFCLNYITWIMRFVSGYKRSIVIDAIIVLQANLTSFLNPAVTIIFQPDINNEFKFLCVKFKLKTCSLFKKIFHQ